MKNKKRLLKYFIQYVLDNDLSISALSTEKEIKRFLKHLKCLKTAALRARISELESTLNNKAWRPGAIVKIKNNDFSKHGFNKNEKIIVIRRLSLGYIDGWKCCATDGDENIWWVVVESEGEVVG
jgi:hypothetical protein